MGGVDKQKGYLRSVRILLLMLIVGTSLGGATLKAQHSPLLSQYMFNQLIVNPAYTGSRDALSVTGLFRRQWVGLNGAPRTESFYLHTPLPNSKNNFGFNLVHDRIGVTNNVSINGSYAYRIDFGEDRGRLAFGLQGGVSLIQSKFSQVVTDVPGDDVFGADSPTFRVPRVGFGVYFDTRTWYVGASAPFLISYENDAYKSYNQNSIYHKPYMLMGGFLVPINPDLLLRPSVLTKYIAGSGFQFDLNANLIIKDALWLGGSYRSRDGLVGMIEYQLNPQLRFGYAYDYNLTPLQNYNHGSHEFMIRYEFGYEIKAMSPRYF